LLISGSIEENMRVAYSCILLFVLVGSLHGKPAQDPTREEIDFVRPTRRNYNVPVINMGGEQPVVDTGYFPDSDFDLGSSWTSTFDDLFTRMRNQFASIFNSLPGFSGNGTGLSSVGSFGFPSFGNVDLSKGNTTSVTKVIDGHKVVINETTYNNNDDNGGTYFKVRIINVHPDDESTDQPKPEESGVNYNQPKDRETLESSAENEISKHKEEDLMRIQLLPAHRRRIYDRY